eukprot:CAMPEP_0114686402 /NCGR_PEP_ID=MMETSP0191-20121206/61457_1 /TAXON_ID=126664 /ORGANISM="Sorites sp." /LENGTH=55 /DNA_ID=CAMNT_0001971879 /DNA_START=230 /DNA_END=394 /DNA_ORIENTATION=+
MASTESSSPRSVSRMPWAKGCSTTSSGLKDPSNGRFLNRAMGYWTKRLQGSPEVT